LSGRALDPKEASMATPLASRPAKEVSWHVVASGLILVALLAAPIAIVATMASPQPNEVMAAGETAAVAGLPLDNPIVTDPGNIGNFAFGYVEFDVDPRRPGGVTGFDSWPPGSPRR
jgi:hypothetical protein